MAQGGAGSGDTSLSKRGFSSVKRQLRSLGADIRDIRYKGFAALSSSTDRGLFKGMFNTLPDLFRQFNEKWEELHEFNDIPIDPPFPTAEDENYRKEIKTYHYECHNYHLQISAKTQSSDQNVSILEGTINANHNTSRAILPKISIKSFSGADLAQWPCFKQLFISLIKEEPSLSDAERFHYLVGCLTGQAYDAIKHIAVVSENFGQAWTVLLKTYDDPRKLACSYLNKFLSFRSHPGKPTAESLQSYISNVSESIASLRNLAITDLSEYLLCELALRSLDPFTREAFETSIIGTTFPMFSDLQSFVQNRCHVLRITFANQQPQTPPTSVPRNVQNHPPPPKLPNRFIPRFGSKQALMTQASLPQSTKSCFVCNENHTISLCPRFRDATPRARLELLRSFGGCRNCMSVHHQTLDCKSAHSCRVCGKRHHTDLHIPTPADATQPSTPHQKTSNSSPQATPGSSGFAGSSTTRQSGVLLGTIIACLQTAQGETLRCRGILDPGSQYSFLTENCAQRLRLKTKHQRLDISGINGSPVGQAKGLASVTFITDHPAKRLRTEAVVIPTITPPLPQTPLDSSKWDIYLTYDLSDVTFMTPGPISFLIGADLFADVVTDAPMVVLDDGPRLLPTIFGLTVMGRYQEDVTNHQSVTLLVHDNLLPVMERFWEVEEPSYTPTLSPEDEICERHFLQTHYRAGDGRYVVSLPFRTTPPHISPNIPRATSYFLSLESRLEKNPELKAAYHDQLAEYLELGHLSRAKGPASYVIPHHAVFKDAGGQRKLRIVFDASFKSATGSLNHHLLTGPKLQSDISVILLNFRIHQFVFSCDIVKMFRQIWLNPEQRHYLQILWRNSPEDPLDLFELNTVTFGLSCSPFLAQRVIRQHALNYQHQYPQASHILLNSTYIDDATAGSNSLSHLTAIKAELIEMLRLGGFELSKWSSNHLSLLEPTSDPSGRPVQLCTDLPESKILGMHWNPVADTLSYKVRAPPNGNSRRILLSCIAQLYDPLGYLAPVVFQAKRLMQQTWTTNLKWDDPLPENISTAWAKFVDELPSLSSISIPRPLPSSKQHQQLLIFGDASASGYCAVSYLRSTSESGETAMTLLKAKTKLAPIKTLTIPRLELCAALLVSRLLTSIQHLRAGLGVEQVFCFTDSATVLAWLNTPPHQLQVFVANRVQQILNATEVHWWSHVRGVDNPADVGSRGVSPVSLEDQRLWWNGPEWCRCPIEHWPNSGTYPTTSVPEIKKTVKVLLTISPPVCASFIDCARRHSKYPRFVRTMAYVKRFIQNARMPNNRVTGEISAQEYEDANLHYIKRLQHHSYSDVFTKPFNALTQELRRLNVFIDPDGLVRVGGRLSHAPIEYDRKYPILLPRRSSFTNLIIDHYHHLNHHIGPAAQLSSIRKKYWIPGAKSLIRNLRYRCVTCRRFSKSGVIPFMGQLPKSRFSEVRAFHITGVDFAGPFLYRSSSLRKAPTQKAYLCLLLCMATRSVHLEVALGLSVEAFLDAFDRFAMRRGVPAEMMSDGGTNFRGSDRYLREVIDVFTSEDAKQKLVRHTAPMNIKWNFNPPSSPHFGGGWEVSIRMVKELLAKTFGNQSFTLPELTTAFTKIEGILNSRPLLSLSDDPADLEPLTPGHFLIGQPITALPEPNFHDIPIGRLNHWQRLRERVQYFWGRWKDEYMSSLQTRQKWDRHVPNLKVNDMVILRDVDSSPTHWPLARILELHPGQDGVVRVVTLRTSAGTYRRPVAKLVPLSMKDIHA